MGSFNVTCTLTHASISPGDPCVLLLLVEGEPYALMDRDPQLAYFPCIIRGEYADYGTLRDVSETPGTALVEAALGVSLEHILQKIKASIDGPARINGLDVRHAWLHGGAFEKFSQYVAPIERSLFPEAFTVKFDNLQEKLLCKGVEDPVLVSMRQSELLLRSLLTRHITVEVPPKLLIEAVLRNNLRGELVQLAWLLMNASQLGLEITPQVPFNYGPQCGNYYMLKAYGKLVSEIAREALKKN